MARADEDDLVEPFDHTARTQRAKERVVAGDVDLESEQRERTCDAISDGLGEVGRVGVAGAVERATGR